MSELANNGKEIQGVSILDLSGIIPAGWKPISEIAPAILSSPSELDYRRRHYDPENLEDHADLGFADLKLCIDRQNEIPKELRRQRVVFWNARAHQGSDGRLVAPVAFYLYWNGSKWCTHYYYLRHGWPAGNSQGCRRKSAT